MAADFDLISLKPQTHTSEQFYDHTIVSKVLYDLPLLLHTTLLHILMYDWSSVILRRQVMRMINSKISNRTTSHLCLIIQLVMETYQSQITMTGCATSWERSGD